MWIYCSRTAIYFIMSEIPEGIECSWIKESKGELCNSMKFCVFAFSRLISTLWNMWMLKNLLTVFLFLFSVLIIGGILGTAAQFTHWYYGAYSLYPFSQEKRFWFRS